MTNLTILNLKLFVTILTSCQLLSKNIKPAHPNSIKISRITNTEYYLDLRKPIKRKKYRRKKIKKNGASKDHIYGIS